MIDQIMAGNAYDKYGSRNPIVRFMMSGFFRDFESLLYDVEINTIVEIGCGEGEIGKRIKHILPDASYLGTDVSEEIIREAQLRNPFLKFNKLSIYDIPNINLNADLIVVSEVFEHLEEPGKAMDALLHAKFNYLLISVPREPVWRILNCVRLKYLREYGNTPGHVNHWSKTRFVRFIEIYSNTIEIEKILSPFPWTMVLCKKK